MRPDESRWPKSPAVGNRSTWTCCAGGPIASDASFPQAIALASRLGIPDATQNFITALRATAGAETVITLDPSPVFTKAEALLRRIEAAGYRVRGYHDTIDDPRGPVIVTATNLTGGETFTAQDPNGDEAAALNQLAHRLGLETAPN